MTRKNDKHLPSSRNWLSTLPVSSFRREMDNLMENFFGTTGLAEIVHANTPSLDISETDQAIEVVTDVPGYKPNEIHVEVGDGRLTISGQQSPESSPEESGRKYHHVERRRGQFTRSVSLPCHVKEDKVQAELKDGVLSIILPKANETHRHKVTIKNVS